MSEVLRTVTGLVTRESREDLEDYQRLIEGYAATFDEPYVMNSWGWKYTESIHPEAFNNSLARDDLKVVLRMLHRDKALASTQPGTLTLEADDKGLRFEAVVDTRRTDANDAWLCVDDGSNVEASFAFWLVEQEWDWAEKDEDKLDHVTLLECDIHRGDVAVCDYGANPNTSVFARNQNGLYKPAGPGGRIPQSDEQRILQARASRLREQLATIIP